MERAERSGGLHKRSAEDWGLPLVARQGRSPSAGLVSLHQRETQRLLLLGSGFKGWALPAGKGSQRCVVEDGNASTHVFSSYDQQKGFKLPFVSELVSLPRVTLFSHSFC